MLLTGTLSTGHSPLVNEEQESDDQNSNNDDDREDVVLGWRYEGLLVTGEQGLPFTTVQVEHVVVLAEASSIVADGTGAVGARPEV